MKKRIMLYVRCFLSLFHIAFVKLLHIHGFKSSCIQDFSSSTHFYVSGGRMSLGKHIHTRKNVHIESDGGTLEVGEGTFFNNGCMVVAKEHIEIGSYTSFGPNVLIFDHDHNIHSDKDIHDSGFITNEIIIGNNVWIGANTVILRGTVLGDGCVVGAGSVIKGEYPPDSVIIQKRSETIRIQEKRKEVAV